MAKFGFSYEVDVDNTENQGGDFEIMPEMNALLQVESATLKIEGDEERPDSVEAQLTFEIIEPEEFKGRKLWGYWLIYHKDGSANNRFFKFGKPNFDRLCRAIELGEPDDTEDLLFKPFAAKVGISIGGEKKDSTGKVVGQYKDKNEIKKFFYPDQPETIPPFGVIEGAARPAPKPAANDNRRPAPAAAATKEPGSKPWAKKAA